MCGRSVRKIRAENSCAEFFVRCIRSYCQNGGRGRYIEFSGGVGLSRCRYIERRLYNQFLATADKFAYDRFPNKGKKDF